MKSVLSAKFYPQIVYGLFWGCWVTVIGAALFYPIYYQSVTCLGECPDITETGARFIQYPGIWGAAFHSFFIGLSATVLSFTGAVVLYVYFRHTRMFAYIRLLLMPVLAVPHSAFALGIVALFSGAGMFARMGKQINSGFEMPDWLLPYHSDGYTMVFALALREMPFILFLLMGNEDSTKFSRFVQLGYTMGYSANQTLIKIWIPYIYPKIRLGLLIVLSFSVSVVDVSIILGPTAPPTLGLMILHFFRENNVETMKFMYPAGILLFLTVLLTFVCWVLIEKGVSAVFKFYVTAGKRGVSLPFVVYALIVGCISVAVYTIMFPSMIIQIFSYRWRFPDLLPKQWSTRNLQEQIGSIMDLFLNSVLLAIAVTVVSLIISIILLEMIIRFSIKAEKKLKVFYLSLIIPQVIIITGLYFFTVRFELDNSYAVLILFHVLFALPYVMLGLSGSWLRYDKKYTDVAETFGVSAWSVFFKVKLPMLARPVIYAAAIGGTVSLGQYVPTIFSMRGHFSTLTTEAVALSSGSDLSISMLVAVFQMIPAFLFFLTAYVAADIILKKHRLNFNL